MSRPAMTFGHRDPRLRGSDWTLVLAPDLDALRAADAAVRLGAPPDVVAGFVRLFRNAGDVGVHWLELDGDSLFPAAMGPGVPEELGHIPELRARVGWLAVVRLDSGEDVPPRRLAEVVRGVKRGHVVRLVLAPPGFER